jgi:hypothetical protein
MFSLMNEVLLSNGKKKLGLITTLLYKMAVDQPIAFTKIVPKTYNNKTVGADNSCTKDGAVNMVTKQATLAGIQLLD